MSISLSDELQIFGERLLLELDKGQNKPTSMFWTDAIAPGEWVLLIALPSALEKVEKSSGNTRDSEGSRIVQIIKRLRGGRDEFRFVIASPKNSLVYALTAMLDTGPDGNVRAIMRNNIVNGRNTGNNFVYRLSRPAEDHG